MSNNHSRTVLFYQADSVSVAATGNTDVLEWADGGGSAELGIWASNEGDYALDAFTLQGSHDNGTSWVTIHSTWSVTGDITFVSTAAQTLGSGASTSMAVVARPFQKYKIIASANGTATTLSVKVYARQHG